MSLKIFLAAAAALAITAGMLIPIPHAGKAQGRSQIATMSVSR